MQHIKPALCIVYIIFCLELYFPQAPEAAPAPKITVILSSGIRPYKEALEGFKDHIEQDVKIYEYRSNPKLIKHILEKEAHDILVAIGPQAAQSIHSVHIAPEDKIYLMVLNPRRFSENGTLCGVDLRIPPETQLKEIRSNLGQGLRVGILYNEVENRDIVEEFAERARELSMGFIAIPVKTPRDCIEELSRRKDMMDVLLFIPDSVVIKEALVQYLLKQCVLNGIIAVGYNHFFVETGAVLSLSVDYQGVGALGAEILKRRWNEMECTLLPPPYTVEWNKKAWDTVRQRR